VELMQRCCAAEQARCLHRTIFGYMRGAMTGQPGVGKFGITEGCRSGQ
jgi:transcriptional regulator with PAS, ATPase and Fis domain